MYILSFCLSCTDKEARWSSTRHTTEPLTPPSGNPPVSRPTLPWMKWTGEGHYGWAATTSSWLDLPWVALRASRITTLPVSVQFESLDIELVLLDRKSSKNGVPDRFVSCLEMFLFVSLLGGILHYFAFVRWLAGD